MDQNHSTSGSGSWVLLTLLSQVASLPRLLFFLLLFLKRPLSHFSPTRNRAHSRGKGTSKPLFTAGRGGQQSSIHLKLGAWYFCSDQRWSPLHGPSSRAFWHVVGATKKTIFPKPGNIPTLWLPWGLRGTFPKPSRLLKWAPRWNHLDDPVLTTTSDSWKKRNAVDTQALLTTAWHWAGPAATIFLTY